MDFDFLVIGGGSAGYAAARSAADAGLRVAVADGSEKLAGLCILRGCMPSKALLQSAVRARVIRDAEKFGLGSPTLTPDLPRIQARKRHLIGDFADYRRGQLTSGKFELIRGNAEFLDAHRVRINDREVSASALCIATGSVIAVPDLPGLREAGFWTSDDILDASSLPRRLVVLGGGAIALEMAYYAAELGSEVTVIQRSAWLLSSFDRDVGLEVEKGLRGHMDIHTGATLQSVEKHPDGGKTVIFQNTDGSVSRVTGDEILLALGRSPATEGLGLKRAGVATERGRIQTNPAKQTSAPHIFAAGDCANGLDVVHTAVTDGETIGRNAARLARGETPLETVDDRLPLVGVFCEPQAASVGLTEAQAQGLGREFESARHPFNDHGKSLIAGVEEGFVKLIVDKTSREIIGAAVVGPEATELIHEIVVAMSFRATAGQLAAIPHYHPTLSEIWTYPAEELA